MANNLKTVYQIEAKGTGELKAAFTQVNNTLAKSGKQAEETSIKFGGLGGGLATVALKFNSILGAASAAVDGIKKLYDVVHEGAKLADASKNFEKTGLSLERLAEASGYTQTNAEIERAIVLTKEAAAANGLAGKAYEDLMYSTLQLADAYDQAIEPTIRTVLKATSGETKALKEQYGIVVDIDGALLEYADSIGKTVNALTEEEKQAARNIAVQNALSDAAENFPTKITVGGLDQVTTSLKNLRDEAKKTAAEFVFGKQLAAGVTRLQYEAEKFEKEYLNAQDAFEKQLKAAMERRGLTHEEALKQFATQENHYFKRLQKAQEEYIHATMRVQEEADYKALRDAERAEKNREIEERNRKRAQLELDEEYHQKRLDLLKSSHQKQIEEIYSQWEKVAQAALDAGQNIEKINEFFQAQIDDLNQKHAKENREKEKARFDAARREYESQQSILIATLGRIDEANWNAEQRTAEEREERAYQKRVNDAEKQIKNQKILQETLTALENEHIQLRLRAREQDEKKRIEEIAELQALAQKALERSTAPATSEEGRARENIENQRKQFEEQLSEIAKAKEATAKLINEGNKEAISQAELLNSRELELIERRKQAELDAQKAIAEARERDFRNAEKQAAQKIHDQIALNEKQREGVDGIIAGTESLADAMEQFGGGAGAIQAAEMLASGIKAGCDAIDYAADSTAAFATGNIVAGIGLAAASVAKFASAAQYAKGLAELGAQGFSVPSQSSNQATATPTQTTGSQTLTGRNSDEKQEISVNLTFKGEQANVGRILIGEMNKEAYVKGGARLNSRVVR